MTINEIQNQIISEFEQFDNWLDKYEYLIELGRDLKLIDNSQKTPENLIRGCQSRVWLVAEIVNDKIKLRADSDAIITKGIIALLLRVFDDQSPQDVLNADLQFIDKIGLRENLSPTRANGLVAMIEQIKKIAKKKINI